jgi:hypothetical protein
MLESDEPRTIDPFSKISDTSSELLLGKSRRKLFTERVFVGTANFVSSQLTTVLTTIAPRPGK